MPIYPQYPGVAYALAYRLARRAVERQLQAQGRRARNLEVIELTRAYRAAHETELLIEAAERVRRNPTLSAMAERQERQRQREERKLARKRVLNPTCLTHR